MGAHIIVEGLVQGVGYRWFVARKAEVLGVRGWVRNVYNGNVEIKAQASRSMLEELIKELKIGPRSARVTNLRIEWEDKDPNEFERFEIR